MDTRDPASSAELLVRIERLERRAGIQRRLVALLGTGLLAACTVAAGKAMSDARFDAITCTRLEIVDEQGRTRLAAGGGGDGVFTQAIYDTKGEKRLILGSLPNGYAGLNLYDPKGNLVVDASCDGGTVTLARADAAPAASNLDEARAQYLAAKAAFDAEEKRVSTLRAFQHQTAGQLAVAGHAWAEAPRVDPEVARRYHAALARYRELGGR